MNKVLCYVNRELVIAEKLNALECGFIETIDTEVRHHRILGHFMCPCSVVQQLLMSFENSTQATFFFLPFFAFYQLSTEALIANIY